MQELHRTCTTCSSLFVGEHFLIGLEEYITKIAVHIARSSRSNNAANILRFGWRERFLVEPCGFSTIAIGTTIHEDHVCYFTKCMSRHYSVYVFF